MDSDRQQRPPAEADKPLKTPNTDMQAEDAGTAESGAEDTGRGTAAEGAMKQTSKTDTETGSQR